jgi:hypothetical protein
MVVGAGTTVFGVDHSFRPMRRRGRRGRGQADQYLIDLAGEVTLEAADDFRFA